MFEQLQENVREATRKFKEAEATAKATLEKERKAQVDLLDKAGILVQFAYAQGRIDEAEKALEAVNKQHRPLVAAAASQYLQATDERPAVPDGCSWRKADKLNVPDEQKAIRHCIHEGRLDVLHVDAEKLLETFPEFVEVQKGLTLVIGAKS